MPTRKATRRARCSQDDLGRPALPARGHPGRAGSARPLPRLRARARGTCGSRVGIEVARHWLATHPSRKSSRDALQLQRDGQARRSRRIRGHVRTFAVGRAACVRGSAFAASARARGDGGAVERAPEHREARVVARIRNSRAKPRCAASHHRFQGTIRRRTCPGVHRRNRALTDLNARYNAGSAFPSSSRSKE